MYGIEYVDGTVGKHNGSVKGVCYFSGIPNRCTFITKDKIRKRLSPNIGDFSMNNIPYSSNNSERVKKHKKKSTERPSTLR